MFHARALTGRRQPPGGRASANTQRQLGEQVSPSFGISPPPQFLQHVLGGPPRLDRGAELGKDGDQSFMEGKKR
jgi:hypothetical protein